MKTHENRKNLATIVLKPKDGIAVQTQSCRKALTGPAWLNTRQSAIPPTAPACIPMRQCADFGQEAGTRFCLEQRKKTPGEDDISVGHHREIWFFKLRR
jgi:hypothetical protein